MIIVKLMGGLGNQMFQYAAARRLAHIHNTDVKIDLSWFSAKTAIPRKYALNALRIRENFVTNEDLAQFPKMPQTKFAEFLRGMISLVKKPVPYGIFAESKLAFNPNVLSLPNNIALIGYWQSYKYFNETRKILIQEFQLKKPFSSKIEYLSHSIKKTLSIGLHVRRGDYVTNPSIRRVHGYCSLAYYQKSIKYIANKIKEPHFFIFSDDIDWVKSNLRPPFKVSYVNDQKKQEGWIDMMLMSYCKHNIIANSSFSWWSAWLNQNPGKIIIGPIDYYKKKSLNRHSADMFPPDWVRL